MKKNLYDQWMLILHLQLRRLIDELWGLRQSFAVVMLRLNNSGENQQSILRFVKNLQTLFMRIFMKKNGLSFGEKLSSSF